MLKRGVDIIELIKQITPQLQEDNKKRKIKMNKVFYMYLLIKRSYKPLQAEQRYKWYLSITYGRERICLPTRIPRFRPGLLSSQCDNACRISLAKCVRVRHFPDIRPLSVPMPPTPAELGR